MPEDSADRPVLARAWSAVEARFRDAARESSSDSRELRLRVPGRDLLGLASYLKTSLGFSSLNDIIGLDNLPRPIPRAGGPREPAAGSPASAPAPPPPAGPAPSLEPAARFTVLYLLFHFREAVRVRLSVSVGEGEPLDSITSLFRSADWAEREIYDMFGIAFAGHPGLRRIYMPDDFPGHPLRKDHPVGWTERGL